MTHIDEPLDPAQRELESRLRSAAAAASAARYDLRPEDLANRMLRVERARRLRRRMGVVVVAAVVIVVFLVPLPQVSLFNRMRRPASTSQTALTWTARDLGPAHFDAVSCPTPSRCVALGPEGWVALTRDGERNGHLARWQTLRAPPSKESCVPRRRAGLAVGKTDQTPPAASALAPSAVAVSTDGGLRWERAVDRRACPRSPRWPRLSNYQGLLCNRDGAAQGRSRRSSKEHRRRSHLETLFLAGTHSLHRRGDLLSDRSTLLGDRRT